MNFLKELPNRSQEAHLRIRAVFNTGDDQFERAVRLLYLNKFGFNGLSRVNRAGGFNVPYEKPPNFPTFPLGHLGAAAVKLRRTTIMIGDFVHAIDTAQAGDIVHCDPPYLLSTTGQSFTAYTSGDFTFAHHMALVEANRRVAAAEPRSWYQIMTRRKLGGFMKTGTLY